MKKTAATAVHSRWSLCSMPNTGKIAVQVLNHYGDAVLKGFGVRKRERLDFAAMTLDDLPVFSYF